MSWKRPTTTLTASRCAENRSKDDGNVPEQKRNKKKRRNKKTEQKRNKKKRRNKPRKIRPEQKRNKNGTKLRKDGTRTPLLGGAFPFPDLGESKEA